MKRTKHPRHGRKRWSIYQLGEDGSSIFLAYGWAYQEVDQVEIATTKALGNHRARYNLDTMKQEAAKHGT